MTLLVQRMTKPSGSWEMISCSLSRLTHSLELQADIGLLYPLDCVKPGTPSAPCATFKTLEDHLVLKGTPSIQNTIPVSEPSILTLTNLKYSKHLHRYHIH